MLTAWPSPWRPARFPAKAATLASGTVASWGIPTLATSNLTDYASDQAAKTDTATKLAVAFAAAL